MRVLHVDRQRHWSGQQARAVLTAVRSRERGIDVLFVTSAGSSYLTRPELRGVPIHLLRLRGRSICGSVVRLARLVRDEGVDVIDAHGAMDHQVAVAARTLSRGVVVVRTKHNHTPLRNAASRFIYNRLTQRIIAISDHVGSVLVESGVSFGSVDVIPDGVDCFRFSPKRTRADARRRFGLPSDAFVVGTSSRPSPRKALHLVAAAVAALRVRGVPAVWLAAGIDAQDASRLCAPDLLDPACVFTPGMITDVEEIFPAFDAYVLSSTEEGLGSAVVEALACEAPVVASRVGGIPEVVVDGETGLLFPSGDVDALVDALHRIRIAPGFGRDLGRAGRRRVLGRFEVGHMVDATIETYERAASRRKTSRD
ncbi:MAG: glycosyltransferase family 4 protein [Planctomycetes bacterium]|nr:glycosyltransferase family 4 protein [Planctomycetota bacterium]MBI3844626.1 glycosyltransferase family 4 protein [Planctomycetota bacterium]